MGRLKSSLDHHSLAVQVGDNKDRGPRTRALSPLVTLHTDVILARFYTRTQWMCDLSQRLMRQLHQLSLTQYELGPMSPRFLY